MRSIFTVFFLAQIFAGAFSSGIHWLEYCKDIKKSAECDVILKEACNRAPTDCIEMLREIPVNPRENLCNIYCVFKNGATAALLTRRQICSFCFEKDIDEHCMQKHLLEELCWSNNVNDQCAEHMHDCKASYKDYCKNLDSGLFFCKQLNSVDGYASAFQLHCTKALEGKRCKTTLESIRMKNFREVYPICTVLCAQAHRLCSVCINTFTRDMTKVGFANELLKKYCERPLVNVTLCSNVIHGDDKPNELTTPPSMTTKAKANRTTKKRPPIPTLPRATKILTTTTAASTTTEPDDGVKLTILYIVAVVLLIILLGVFALVCVKLTKKQQKMKRGRARTASTTRSKGTTSKTKTTTTSTSSGDGPSSVVRQLATHSTVVQCANDNIMTEKAPEKSKSKSKKKKGKGKGKRSDNALNRLRQLDTAGVKENDA